MATGFTYKTDKLKEATEARALADAAKKTEADAQLALKNAKDNDKPTKKTELEDAQKKLKDANENAAKLEKEAEALPDLDETWAKDLTKLSTRKKESALRKMKEDLDKFNNAPPSATKYCDHFEKAVDHEAHHVHCKRCNKEHGLDRSKQAKKMVKDLVNELQFLKKMKPNELANLTQEALNKREIGRRAKGGKMIGVLICIDPKTNKEVVLTAYSGKLKKLKSHKNKNRPPNRNESDIYDLPKWSPAIVNKDKPVLKTADGVEVPLTALPSPKKPHGACAAPKMIQEAYAKGLKPVAIAEAWYGKASKLQSHGDLVASCDTCCKNLDIQLCDHYKKPVEKPKEKPKKKEKEKPVVKPVVKVDSVK